MDLDTFVITVFCWIDDILESLYQGRPLRRRGPSNHQLANKPDTELSSSMGEMVVHFAPIVGVLQLIPFLTNQRKINQ